MPTSARSATHPLIGILIWSNILEIATKTCKGETMEKRTGLAAVHAICETCGWSCYERNAHGVGARHAKHHGHKVSVEQITIATYDYSE